MGERENYLKRTNLLFHYFKTSWINAMSTTEMCSASVIGRNFSTSRYYWYIISNWNLTRCGLQMAVVPRGVIIGMFFYLTFAIAGTIWISMKYLSENGCDCRQYFESARFSAHEHDFPHSDDNFKIVAEKQKRANGDSVQNPAKGTYSHGL